MGSSLGAGPGLWLHSVCPWWAAVLGRFGELGGDPRSSGSGERAMGVAGQLSLFRRYALSHGFGLVVLLCFQDIEWTHIDYFNNAIICDLIENVSTYGFMKV